MTETKADYQANPRFTALSKAWEGIQMMRRGCEIWRHALGPLSDDHQNNPDIYNLFHMVAPGHLEQAACEVKRLMREGQE